jgi:putative ABC transport system permease protein
MKDYSLIFKYSFRLLRREWRRFVLPFLSLTITALVMMLILLLTASSNTLLSEQARELLGGDIVVQNESEIDIESFWEKVQVLPEEKSEQISFNASLHGDNGTTPATVLAIDDNYPLYGHLILETGEFNEISANEILLDSSGVDRLSVQVGDTVLFGETEFSLAGIIITEPTSLMNGFSFFPQAIISQEGFLRTQIDPALLRAEYIYASKFTRLSADKKTELIQSGREDGYRVSAAGSSRSGLQFGLNIVSEFLIVVILVTAVLATANVYVSTLYLIRIIRKTLATFLALGMKRHTLISILATNLGYIILLASLAGILIGLSSFYYISNFVEATYLLSFPVPNIFIYALTTIGLITVIAIGSFIPVIKKDFSISTDQTLFSSNNKSKKKIPIKTLSIVTVSTLIPLIVFASFILKSIQDGILSISIIAVIYIVISVLFYLFVSYLYKKRQKFSFFIKSIIAQKKADGLFGIISFTSLFVALTALGTLTLIQVSLEEYLTEDLSQTIPTTYILDVQPSQKDIVINNFPDLTLFSNTSARILEIDGDNIQKEQDSENQRYELRREFNLTDRTYLLESEMITKGADFIGLPGEISVDQAFAEQSGIKIGSSITFLIQGFEVTGKVTSLRVTDSKSGLPFFYFVLSPDDIAQFPSTYFGYSNYGAEDQKKLSKFLASAMPNVTVIETQTLSELVIKVVQTLILLVLVITIPPLVIATLLIVTLVISSYSTRRRDGARFRTLGATQNFVLKQYLLETISLTLFAAFSAYLFSVIISYSINKYFLELDSSVIFDLNLILILVSIVFFVGMIGIYLYKTDKTPLREILSYEDNI